MTALLFVLLAQLTPLPTYAIGVSDVLSIVVRNDKEMSVDVTVRPDGKISLPLLNDVVAVGRTPEQLRSDLTLGVGKFIVDPEIAVIVKEIHSRTVYITGNVAKSGGYPLNDGLNVLQLIAVSGGVLEYAKKGSITIVRTVAGKEQRFPFNYNDALNGRKTNNLSLIPGDVVLVP